MDELPEGSYAGSSPRQRGGVGIGDFFKGTTSDILSIYPKQGAQEWLFPLLPSGRQVVSLSKPWWSRTSIGSELYLSSDIGTGKPRSV
jgi:hypothetical protein